MSKESFCGILSNLQTKPTRPIKYGFNSDLYKKTARSSVNDLDNDTGYMWEKSGLLEGDIMTYRAEERNGIRGGKYVWYDATIPFYIEADDFDAEQIETILDAMDEFNYKTCIRFRPFVKSDRNWIVITGNETGCWSSVGMQEEGGQQLNLQAPECLKQGEIMHELLHAAGFYHQHSNRVRDNYVQINWENIEEGHESDFQKHNITIEYGTKYDYDSIMHYSRKVKFAIFNLEKNSNLDFF